MIKENDLSFKVQPSAIRAFSDKFYEAAGADLGGSLDDCKVVFAVKEIPIEMLREKKTYAFFSHTVKGQKHNMPLLRKLLDLGCTLIDYEKVVDDEGKRLIFFGRQAGQAGMVDTLHALGKRLSGMGIDTPFSKLNMTHEYHNYGRVREHVGAIGDEIEKNGLPKEITPFVCGFSGYGNVSQGAQEVFDLLPFEEVTPAQLRKLVRKNDSQNKVYKVVFREKDLVKPVLKRDRFNLKEYYSNPERYKSCFSAYLPYLSMLMNCIYWSDRYPRLVTKEDAASMFSDGATPKLMAIGDVSCDIGGSIEFTVKSTEPDNPCFVYNPRDDSVTDGVDGEGMLVMAVDNLPCELPRDATRYFGEALLPYVPEIVHCDYSKPFKELKLSRTIKEAVIVHGGKLAPAYEYLEKYL